MRDHYSFSALTAPPPPSCRRFAAVLAAMAWNLNACTSWPATPRTRRATRAPHSRAPQRHTPASWLSEARRNSVKKSERQRRCRWLRRERVKRFQVQLQASKRMPAPLGGMARRVACRRRTSRARRARVVYSVDSEQTLVQQADRWKQSGLGRYCIVLTDQIMTILEEEKPQTASTVGTNIPSSISSSGVGPVNLKTSVTAASAAAAALSGSSPSTHLTSNDSGINNNTGAKNHIINNMISNVADRYITPEYLAPLPSSVRTFLMNRVSWSIYLSLLKLIPNIIVIAISAMFIFYSFVQSYSINIAESTMTINMTGKTWYNAHPIDKVENLNSFEIYIQKHGFLLINHIFWNWSVSLQGQFTPYRIKIIVTWKWSDH